MNITLFSNMGFGISFRIEVVVCGLETLVCSGACTTRTTQNQVIAAPTNVKTFAAAL
jgi:hypothetical protein